MTVWQMNREDLYGKRQKNQGLYFAGNGLRLPRVLLLGKFGFNRSTDRCAITLGMVRLPHIHQPLESAERAIPDADKEALTGTTEKLFKEATWPGGLCRYYLGAVPHFPPQRGIQMRKFDGGHNGK
jgi:hypothetical protein